MQESWRSQVCLSIHLFANFLNFHPKVTNPFKNVNFDKFPLTVPLLEELANMFNYQE